jgi:predicted nucleic acid-binding protein
VTGFILDTSVYVGAFRDRDLATRLREFHRRFSNRVSLAAVVALELRAGARTPAQEAALDDLIGAYGSRTRLVAPSEAGWLETGRLLARLATVERRGATMSLTNDALLAVTVRETNSVLVTANARDFAALQRHLRGFQFRETSALM